MINTLKPLHTVLRKGNMRARVLLLIEGQMSTGTPKYKGQS